MEQRKQHFRVGELKEIILKFVLRHEMPVTEPEVTEFLKEDYNLNRASVNRHLNGLEDLECITKVIPVKKSRFNYWDIDFKNLKNIKKEFPDIQLKDYRKAKDLIIKINFPDNLRRLHTKYFIYMSLFQSLFEIFLNNEFKQLFLKAAELWQIENYRDQNHKRHVLFEKICRHFYETDFLTGKAVDNEKLFIKNLDELIKKVNIAYNTVPSKENPHPVEEFQEAVDKLDAFYEEWYEKCL